MRLRLALSLGAVLLCGMVENAAAQQHSGVSHGREALRGKPQETVTIQAVEGTPVPLTEEFKTTLNGDYVAAGVGLRGSSSGSITISLPEGFTIQKAFLYWAIIDSATTPSNSIVFNGTSKTGTLVGQTDDPCWPPLTTIYVFRADVTAQAQTGPNTVSLTAGSESALREGASLVVIFSKAGEPARTVIVYDGAITFFSTTVSTTITTFRADSPPGAKITWIVADGQTSGNNVLVDGTVIASNVLQGDDPPPGTAFADRMWDTLTQDITSFVAGGDTSVTLGIQSSGGDCLTWAAQVLSVKQNHAPSADAGGPYTVPEGGSVTLTGTGSDPDGDTLTFAWDLDNDGTFETSGQTVTFSAAGLDGPSTRTVVLRVTDAVGSTTDTATVTINNVAPTVTAPVNQTANEGEVASFSLGSFSDPGANDGPWTVTVSWGDGSPNTTSSVSTQGSLGTQSHTYADNGTYSVTVQVTDKDGGKGSASFQVTIANVAPTVTAPANQTANEGEVFSPSLGSFSDPGANDGPWTVTVNWGDGSSNTTFSVSTQGSLGTKPHTYADNGTYTVTVQVTDKDTGTGSATFQVMVANLVPKVTPPANQTASEGSSTSFSLGSFTDPGPNDGPWPVTVHWGDGFATTITPRSTQGPLPALSHTYADNGTYTVEVQVTDKDNATGSASFQVTVANVAPTVTAPANQTANEGSATSFSLGSFSDPGADSPWAVTVNWGDGSPNTTFSVGTQGSLGTQSHTYADNDTYIVTVQVQDKDNGAGSAIFQVTVANVAPTIAAPASFAGSEGDLITFNVTASDPGADVVTLAPVPPLPDGATFFPNPATSNPTATGQFTWTPHSGQGGGVHLVLFSAHDGETSHTVTVPISVADNIADADGDGVPDSHDLNGDGIIAPPSQQNPAGQFEQDNCKDTPNPLQEDSDADGIGNHCDPIPQTRQLLLAADVTADGSETDVSDPAGPTVTLTITFDPVASGPYLVVNPTCFGNLVGEFFDSAGNPVPMLFIPELPPLAFRDPDGPTPGDLFKVSDTSVTFVRECRVREVLGSVPPGTYTADFHSVNETSHPARDASGVCTLPPEEGDCFDQIWLGIRDAGKATFKVRDTSQATTDLNELCSLGAVTGSTRLSATCNAALQLLQEGNFVGACGKLKDFIQQVQASKLDDVEKQTLIDKANEIRRLLAC